MNDKRTALPDEEPKYRKKSKNKGQPRADHKHQYEVVLLTKYYHYNDFKTGKPAVRAYINPYRICMVCGRIDDIILHDEIYYTKTLRKNVPIRLYDEDLSEYALSLPKWEADFFDKFAKPMSEGESNNA